MVDQLEEIRRRVDIVEFIGQYLPLKKAGRNFRSVCPFHSDKDPSLMVSPDKQIWHCFGCGAGGDIFGFLMKKEGLEFPEALAQLADRAGVELANRSRDWGMKSKLFTINDLAAKFYEKYITDTATGRQAANYLINRGLTAETIKAFQVGYAPAGWDYFAKFIERRGYTKEDGEKAGLLVRRNQNVMDKFRHRLMFPITNVSGQVVGFTGRVLDAKDQPKYLNSPETPIFNKGRILYGLSITKEEIQKSDAVVLVEGQMDALSSYQAGVKNVVASSGTAFTGEQLETLRRYAETLILALDADSAGSEATKRAIELASAKDLDVKVALLEGYKDPDECAKADPAKWREIVGKAVPIVDFYIDYATKKFGNDSVPAKKKVVAEVLPIVALLDSPVEKDQYIKQLAKSLNINPDNLYEALSRAVSGKGNKLPAKSAKEPVQPVLDRSDWLEKRILGMVVAQPDRLEGITTELVADLLVTKWAKKVYAELKNCYTGGEFSLDNLLAKLDYPDRVILLENLMTVEEYYANMPSSDVDQELRFYVNLLKQKNTRVALAEINRQIVSAEKSGDVAKLQALLEEFNHRF
ncbi:DNA primase [Patescibacteria group bacterium]|nr:DNA primase [Patescibacteria group bacterium]